MERHCEACTSADCYLRGLADLSTFHPRRPSKFPPGLRYAARTALGRPAALASYSWLAVTHTGEAGRGARVQGTWFYFAPGCSDLLLSVGALLVARNRCHAALLLAVGAGDVLSETDPATATAEPSAADAERVAAWVERHETAWPALRKARSWARTDAKRPNASVAFLLAECARGLHGNCSGAVFDGRRLRPCTPLWRRRRRGEVEPRTLRAGEGVGKHVLGPRRFYGLAALAASDQLSRYVAERMGAAGFDTLAMYEQPLDGGSAFDFTTELWFLPSELGSAASADIDAPGPLRDALLRRLRLAASPPTAAATTGNWSMASRRAAGVAPPPGSRPCVPSAGWAACAACEGSALARHCDATHRLRAVAVLADRQTIEAAPSHALAAALASWPHDGVAHTFANSSASSAGVDRGSLVAALMRRGDDAWAAAVLRGEARQLRSLTRAELVEMLGGRGGGATAVLAESGRKRDVVAAIMRLARQAEARSRALRGSGV